MQLTRSFRALKIWMALKTYGAARFRGIIDQCLDLAEYAVRPFQRSPRLAIITPPSLGVFTFRYKQLAYLRPTAQSGAATDRGESFGVAQAEV